MIIFEKATPALSVRLVGKRIVIVKTRMRRTERSQIDETKSFLAETRLDIEIAAEDMDDETFQDIFGNLCSKRPKRKAAVLEHEGDDEDDGAFLQTARENTGTDQKLHDRAAL